MAETITSIRARNCVCGRERILGAVLAMDKKWSIDKLNGSNWMTWKFQMRHLLLAKELWGIVDGSEVLAEDAAQQAYKRNLQRGHRRRSPPSSWPLMPLSCS